MSLATLLMLAGTTPAEFVPPPDPYGLPAPGWLFALLLTVTTGVHFLCMNAMLACAVIAVVLDALHLLGGRDRHHVVRVLYQALPVLVSLTITTGVAPLLFVQTLYGPLFYPATVLMGWTWLAIVPALIVGFYVLKIVAYRMSNAALGLAGRWDHAPAPRLALGLVVLATFLAVAWILTQSHMLEIQPEQWPQQQSWKQTRLIVTPDLSLPRYGHNVGGAVAIGGLFVAAMGHWRLRRGRDAPHEAEAIIRAGLAAMLIAWAANVVLGPVMFSGLPQAAREPLTRVNLLSVLWWLGLAAVVAQGPCAWVCLRRIGRLGPFVILCGLAAVGLGGMLAAREQVRLALLGRPEVGFRLDGWPVYPQYSALLVFLLCFALACGVIVWIVRVMMSARPEPDMPHDAAG